MNYGGKDTKNVGNYVRYYQIMCNFVPITNNIYT